MLKITSPTFCLFHWNIHNVEIPAEVLREILEAVRSQCELVRADPMRVGLIQQGDFNIANSE
eukprot:4147291-Pyramimonas_sp.AAC.1